MSDDEIIDLYFRAPWQWKILIPLLPALHALAALVGDYFRWTYVLGS